ncbi:MAG: nickel-dependent lactate racemase [Candidatus Wukongarchaeota archaeon]|nr:nickel-dependent lactate racemase [Candidatus Wukongarchaeota archaeon]
MTVKVKVPYGSSKVSLDIPEENFAEILKPGFIPGVENPQKLIEESIKNPLNSKPLEEIVSAGDTGVMVVDDKTRSSPSYLMVPILANYLNELGVSDKDITILIATGTHSPMRDEEGIMKLLGEEVVNRFNIVSHDCDNAEFEFVGTTSRGTPVKVNKIFTSADVKILTGDVNLHYYAGYGGGRKSLLPGISARETISANHAMMTDCYAITGNLGDNPLSDDMIEAAKLVGPDFTLNVVLNTKKEIVASFAGDMETVLFEGVKIVDKMAKIPAKEAVDILVISSGGFPKDINLYQALKAVDQGLAAVKEGETIIFLAECKEGVGNNVFLDWTLKYRTYNEAMKAINDGFCLGGHKAFYLQKALSKAQIYVKSSMDPKELEETFMLKPVDDVQSLLQKLLNENPEAKISIFPYGNDSLATLKKREVVTKLVH